MIFKRYMEEFEITLGGHQQGKKWTYYKSCTEPKLRKQAGHVFVANAIWQSGLPALPRFATEQRRLRPNVQGQDPQLTDQDLLDIPWAIQNVLNWLDRIAVTLLIHHTTDEYGEALRKSGTKHRQSDLSATEQKTRAAIRKAKFDMQAAKDLAAQGENYTLTWAICHRWQKTLLKA